MAADTPLLLIAWRRPDTLRQVIDAIRPVAPQRLFVACDGPNSERPGEAEKVAATRAVIEGEIDWPCTIERLYSNVNQGCRLGVSRAITWFFEQVEEGIILEDDCVPHPDFFNYCARLLERYRNDARILSICGSNFQQGQQRGSASYYFSIYGDSWGWATWRRAWRLYPEAQEKWFEFRDAGMLGDVFSTPGERDYWQAIYDNLFIRRTPDSWAYQWWLASWMNNGLHAWPNASLVSNVGFNLPDSTHCFGDYPYAALTLSPLGDVTHPSFIIPSREADEFAFAYRRNGLSRIERDRYGWRYPWILRKRALEKEGVPAYLAKRILRAFARA